MRTQAQQAEQDRINNDLIPLPAAHTGFDLEEAPADIPVLLVQHNEEMAALLRYTLESQVDPILLESGDELDISYQHCRSLYDIYSDRVSYCLGRLSNIRAQRSEILGQPRGIRNDELVVSLDAIYSIYEEHKNYCRQHREYYSMKLLLLVEQQSERVNNAISSRDEAPAYTVERDSSRSSREREISHLDNETKIAVGISMAIISILVENQNLLRCDFIGLCAMTRTIIAVCGALTIAAAWSYYNVRKANIGIENGILSQMEGYVAELNEQQQREAATVVSASAIG